MIISGTTGIGKSELCAYFKNNLKKKGLDKYLLYLHKDANIAGVHQELIEFYKKATGLKFEDTKEDAFELFKHPKMAAMALLQLIVKNINEELLDIFNNDTDLTNEFLHFLEEGITVILKNKESTRAERTSLTTPEDIKKYKTKQWMKEILKFIKKNTDEEISKYINYSFENAVYIHANVKPVAFL